MTDVYVHVEGEEEEERRNYLPNVREVQMLLIDILVFTSIAHVSINANLVDDFQ